MGRRAGARAAVVFQKKKKKTRNVRPRGPPPELRNPGLPPGLTWAMIGDRALLARIRPEEPRSIGDPSPGCVRAGLRFFQTRAPHRIESRASSFVLRFENEALETKLLFQILKILERSFAAKKKFRNCELRSKRTNEKKREKIKERIKIK